MPTNNKTPNLALNSWLGTDKPTRTDFVNDNVILDDIISTHMANEELHFTTSEKAWISQPYYIRSYLGNGEESKEVIFDFNPKCILIHKKGSVLYYYDTETGYNVYNSAIALQTSFSSAGVSLYNNILTVYQTVETPQNNYFYNLNASGIQYVCIAFK